MNKGLIKIGAFVGAAVFSAIALLVSLTVISSAPAWMLPLAVLLVAVGCLL